MKTVWILNHYAGKMFFNKGGRHYNFAKFLREHDYRTVVFCCNARHGGVKECFFDTQELWTEQMAEDIETPFVYVKGRMYANNGKERILNMFDFYRNVKKAAKEYARTKGEPDVILASSVHPLTLLAGIKLAKKFGVPCICEMRDLWPEAIVAYSRRIHKKSLIAKVLYAGEKWLYKKADALIFTQEGGADYIREHKWDKSHGGPIDINKAFHINNGVDLEAFDKNLEAFPYEDADLDDKESFKVVYTGAIRRINNLGLIVDAAKLIKDPAVKFYFWGDGDEVEPLKERIKEEGITNVKIKGWVNKQYIPSIVSRSDLNLVHWEMNPLLRVGESYNKAFEYFAAGKPVFYTVRPGYSIVEKYNCGKMTEGFQPEDLAAGIEAMAKLSQEEKLKMAKNARIAAKAYDFKKLTADLVDIIETL